MCVGFLAQTAQAEAKPSKRGGKLQAETWRGQSRYSETSTGGRADLKRRDEPAGCQSHHDHWPDFSGRQRGGKKTESCRRVSAFLFAHFWRVTTASTACRLHTNYSFLDNWRNEKTLPIIIGSGPELFQKIQ